MTRKDYILLAEVFRVEHHNLRIAMSKCGIESASLQLKAQFSTIENCAASLADSLARENSRFNKEHFLAVVRGEKDLLSRPARNEAR